MSYVGRYAPSPTGPLHLGNLFAAVWATYRTRRVGGRLFLRMEDLDAARCRPEYADCILEDLDTLGFKFDAGPGSTDSWGPYVQSERLHFYESALRELSSKGRIYRCRCSRKDIANHASAPHAGEEGPVYPGICKGRVLSEQDVVALRFSVSEELVCVEDHWAGRFCQHLPTEVGDFVVQRKDGVVAYHLAVVVDDALQGVTEVVRGRDLLASSPRQVSLFRALGYPPPSFAHLPLWVDDSGHRLAKRRGNQTLRALLEQETPDQVLSRVGVVLGVCEPGEPLQLDELLLRMDDAMGRRERVSGAPLETQTPSLS
ncbi:MAG: tRNA glutamyl-Q(34) synthetase GluQRS [Myxococcota bacterium]|nr:tRNA glutamyl-Q(34) synthetase GluQRS [Myxococcota bacterium]